MYKSNNVNLIISIIVNSISIFSALYLFMNHELIPDGYQNIFLLPIAFCIFYNVFIRVVMKKYGISLFLIIYLLVSFFRFVILSVLVVESNWFYGRSNYSPAPLFFENAIYIMIYELLIYNIAIYLFHKFFFENIRKKQDDRIEIVKDTNNINFSKNNIIYTVFVVLTFMLVVVKPNSLNYFSFFTVNNNFTKLEELDILTSIVVMFLNVARLIIYFIIIGWIIRNIQPKSYLFSFFLVVFVTLINSLIFFGTNRSDFIFNFVVNLLILIYLYKKLGVTINIMFLGLLPIVVSGMSQFRETVTITGGTNKLVDITDNLQVYLGGIYNVAMSLDITSSNGNVLMMFIDIFKSAIGPNMILKNIELTTSAQLFNYRIYLSDHIAQIIPMIGQGNLYLGPIVAPLLGVSFIFIAVFLTKQIVRFKRIELVYIFTLFSGRIGFVMAQNGNILINDLTFFLPLFLLVYYLNNKVVVKN